MQFSGYVKEESSWIEYSPGILLIASLFVGIIIKEFFFFMVSRSSIGIEVDWLMMCVLFFFPSILQRWEIYRG